MEISHARLFYCKQKEKIKRAPKRLNGTGIYINNDFSFETSEIRKELLKTAKELRLQGKGTKVVTDRLVTWEREKLNNEGTERTVDILFIYFLYKKVTN